MRVSRCWLTCLSLALAAPAWGQTTAIGPASPTFGIRGFAEAGQVSLRSTDSFRAILGEATGPVFGGGAQVLLPWGLFADISANRFRERGTRVFRHDGEIFKLGIPITIRIIPVELTGGYRFARWRWIVPYGGAGVGSTAYRETSRFAEAEENVDERFRSYHVLAGAEIRIWRWISAAVEGHNRWVPDAIGEDGISREFGEDDIGGPSMNVRVIVGIFGR